MISILFARMPKGCSLNAHHVKGFHPQAQSFEPELIQHITSTTWKYSAEIFLFECSHNRISSNVRTTSSPVLTKEVNFEKGGLWTIKELSKSKNAILWVVCLLLLFYLYFWWQAGIKKWGTDEEKFIEIFTTRSFAQLRAMLPEYKTVITRTPFTSVLLSQPRAFSLLHCACVSVRHASRRNFGSLNRLPIFLLF